MKNESSPENDSALAKLALGLQQDRDEPPVYSPPSDEELILLAEGKLNATRRAQILDVLSTNKASFNRWVSMIDGLETVGELPEVVLSAESKSASKIEVESPSIWQKFSASLMGGGVAAFATVLVVVALVRDPAPRFDDVDGLYEHYSSEFTNVPLGSALGSSSPSLRGGAVAEKTGLTPYEYEILAGVIDGLEQLGMDTETLEFPKRAPDQSLNIEQERKKLLNIVGKTAILMHAKCQIGASDAFYEESHSIVERLQDELAKIDSPDMKPLSRKAPKGSSFEQHVCFFASRTVRRVIPNV